MKYPVVEIFYSIQGEGHMSGHPATFIRLAGCPVNCDFCDTPDRNDPKMGEMSIADILGEVSKVCCDLSGLVIITGGEPLIHPLTPLLNALIDADYTIIIETSGIKPLFEINSGSRIHYSVSPKPGHPVSPGIVIMMDSIKILCDLSTTREDIFTQIHKIAGVRSLRDFPEIYLQPKVDPKVNSYFSNLSVKHTINLALQTGAVISLQLHKIMGVK